MHRKLIAIIIVDFETTGQQMIIHFAFPKYFEKLGCIAAMQQILLDFKKD